MRNRNVRDFIRVASSQFIGMIISIFRSLILPLYLGVLEYGYFQSYLFYVSLIPIIALGYNDGIYLKYGNYEYEDLPFRRLSYSNNIFIVVSLILAIVIFSISCIFVEDVNLQRIIFLSCIYGFFLAINTLLMQILQVTRRFQLYSKVTVLTKLSSLLLILFVLCLGGNFLWIILVDVISFSLITFYLVYINKRLFSIKYELDAFYDYRESIKAGFPLLIAGLIGLLYLGAGRLIVQVLGGMEDFSYYSFSLSIASFVSIAISSVSLVVYPMLSRYKGHEQIIFYNTCNSYVRILILFIPIIYYITYMMIKWFYQDYISVLQYLNVVFIMMYIQAFMYILHNTYYKVQRLERSLFIDNLISVFILFLIGIPVYYHTRQIFAVSIVTLSAMLIRYFISIWRLSKTMNIKLPYNTIELSFALLFIIATSYSNVSLCSIILVLSISLLYCFHNRSEFKGLIKYIFK